MFKHHVMGAEVFRPGSLLNFFVPYYSTDQPHSS
jgi:hypothetical protein